MSEGHCSTQRSDEPPKWPDRVGKVLGVVGKVLGVLEKLSGGFRSESLKVFGALSEDAWWSPRLNRGCWRSGDY